jgi:diketogulonate reductase-like aldo/keto reductase
MAIKKAAVSRDKLFITTKVLPNISDIPGALKLSLQKLQVDHVDL